MSSLREIETESFSWVVFDAVVAILGIGGAHDDEMQQLSGDRDQEQLVRSVQHLTTAKYGCMQQQHCITYLITHSQLPTDRG